MTGREGNAKYQNVGCFFFVPSKIKNGMENRVARLEELKLLPYSFIHPIGSGRNSTHDFYFLHGAIDRSF